MFKCDFSRTLIQMVDIFLPKGSNQRINYCMPEASRDGICFELQLEVSDPNKDYDSPGSRSISRFFVMFTSNVSVYVADVTNEDYSVTPFTLDPQQWENTSNHDSCWRTDGLRFLNERYFEMCKKVNDSVAPIKLETDATFSRFGRICDPVRITYRVNVNYHNTVLKVEKANSV